MYNFDGNKILYASCACFKVENIRFLSGHGTLVNVIKNSAGHNLMQPTSELNKLLDNTAKYYLVLDSEDVPSYVVSNYLWIGSLKCFTVRNCYKSLNSYKFAGLVNTNAVVQIMCIYNIFRFFKSMFSKTGWKK